MTTVPDVIRKITYDGDDSTLTFPFAFSYRTYPDIRVYTRLLESPFTKEDLALDIDYIISGQEVRIFVPLGTTKIMSIVSDWGMSQTVDYDQGSVVNPKILNRSLDEKTVNDQELRDVILTESAEDSEFWADIAKGEAEKASDSAQDAASSANQAEGSAIRAEDAAERAEDAADSIGNIIPPVTNEDIVLSNEIGAAKLVWRRARSEIPLPSEGNPGQALTVDSLRQSFILSDVSGVGSSFRVEVGDGITTYNLKDIRFKKTGSKWVTRDTLQEVILMDGSTIDLDEYPELKDALGFLGGSSFLRAGIIPQDVIAFATDNSLNLTCSISIDKIYVRNTVASTWTEVVLSNLSSFRCVSMRPDGSEIVIGGASGLLLHSIDQGLTWQSLPLTNETINSIALSDDVSLLAFESGNIARTIDFSSLVVINIGNNIPIKKMFLNPSSGFAQLCGNNSLIAKSEDSPNFENWIIENNPTPSLFTQIGNWDYSLALDPGRVIRNGNSLAGTERKVNYAREGSQNYYSYWDISDWTTLSGQTNSESTFIGIDDTNMYRFSISAGSYKAYFGVYGTNASTLIGDTEIATLHAGANQDSAVAIAGDEVVKIYDETGLLHDLEGDSSIKTLGFDNLQIHYSYIKEIILNPIAPTTFSSGSEWGGVTSKDANLIELTATAFLAGRKNCVMHLEGRVRAGDGVGWIYTFNNFVLSSSGETIDKNPSDTVILNGGSTAAVKMISCWINLTGTIENYVIFVFRRSGFTSLRYAFFLATEGRLSSSVPTYDLLGTTSNASSNFNSIYFYTDEIKTQFFVEISPVDSILRVYDFLISGTITKRILETKTFTLLPQHAKLELKGIVAINSTTFKFLCISAGVSTDRDIVTFDYVDGVIDPNYAIIYTLPPSEWQQFDDVMQFVINNYPRSERGAIFALAFYRNTNEQNKYIKILENSVEDGFDNIFFREGNPQLNYFNYEAANTSSLVDTFTLGSSTSFNMCSNRAIPQSFSVASITDNNKFPYDLSLAIDSKYLLSVTSGTVNVAAYALITGDGVQNGQNFISETFGRSNVRGNAIFATTNNQFVIAGSNQGDTSYLNYDGIDIEGDEPWTGLPILLNDRVVTSFNETTGYLLLLSATGGLYQVNYDGSTIGTSWTNITTTSVGEYSIITDRHFIGSGVAEGASSTNLKIYWFDISTLPTPTVQELTIDTGKIFPKPRTIFSTRDGKVIYILGDEGLALKYLDDGINDPTLSNWSVAYLNNQEGDPFNFYGGVLTFDDSKIISIDNDRLVTIPYFGQAFHTNPDAISDHHPPLPLEISTITEEKIENFPQGAILLPNIAAIKLLLTNVGGNLLLFSQNLLHNSQTGEYFIVTGRLNLAEESIVVKNIADGVIIQNHVEEGLIGHYHAPDDSYILTITSKGKISKYEGVDFQTRTDSFVTSSSLTKLVNVIVWSGGWYLIVLNSVNQAQAIVSTDLEEWSVLDLADIQDFEYNDIFDSSIDDATLPTKLFLQTDIGVLIGDITEGIPQTILRDINADDTITERYVCGDEGIFARHDEGSDRWVEKTTGTTVSLKTVTLYTDPLELSVTGEDGVKLDTVDGGDNFSSSVLGDGSTIEDFASTPSKSLSYYADRQNFYSSTDQIEWMPSPAILTTACGVAEIFQIGGNKVSYVGGIDEAAIALTYEGEWSVIAALTGVETDQKIVGFVLRSNRVYCYFENGNIYRTGISNLTDFTLWADTVNPIFIAKGNDLSVPNEYFFAGGVAGTFFYDDLDLGTAGNTGEIGNITTLSFTPEPVSDGSLMLGDAGGRMFFADADDPTATITEIVNLPTTAGIISCKISLNHPEKRIYATESNEVVLTLNTGGDWQLKDDFPEKINVAGVPDAGNPFTAVGGDSTGYIAYSEDGEPWEDFTLQEEIGSITAIISIESPQFVIGGTELGEQFFLSIPNINSYPLNNTLDKFPTWLVATSFKEVLYKWQRIDDNLSILQIENDFDRSGFAYYVGGSGNIYTLSQEMEFVLKTNPWDNEIDVFEVGSGNDYVLVINSSGETAATTDSADSWTVGGSLGEVPKKLAISPASALVVLIDGSLFKSVNQGQSWAIVDITAIDGDIIDLEASRTGGFWIFSTDTGYVYKSSDEAGSFREVTFHEDEEFHIAILQTNVYLLFENKIYFSTDFGETYEEKIFAESFVDIDVSEKRVCLLKADGDIYSAPLNLQYIVEETAILQNITDSVLQIESSYDGETVLGVGNQGLIAVTVLGVPR